MCVLAEVPEGPKRLEVSSRKADWCRGKAEGEPRQRRAKAPSGMLGRTADIRDKCALARRVGHQVKHLERHVCVAIGQICDRAQLRR